MNNGSVEQVSKQAVGKNIENISRFSMRISSILEHP